MKKIIITGVIIALLTTGIFAFTQQNKIEFEKNFSQIAVMSISEEVVEDDFFNDPMFELLGTIYQDRAQKEKAIDDYATTKHFKKMTESEKIYLYNLTTNKGDFFAIMEIYNFWKTTVEPMQMIEEIYENRSDQPNNLWIEKAYNKITNSKNGVLTDEKAEIYVNEGLSEYELFYAKLLSRKNVYKVDEVINKIKNKKSWLEVTDEIYSKTEIKH